MRKLYVSSFLLIFLVVFYALTLQGCASAGKAKADNNVAVQAVSFVVAAQNNINPNLSGQASPVILTIYQLKNVTAFNTADVFTLYQDPKAALGDDLISQQQVVLKPGENLQLNATKKAETQYIGVMAAFANLNGKSRASVKYIQNTAIIVELSGSNVAIKESK